MVTGTITSRWAVSGSVRLLGEMASLSSYQNTDELTQKHARIEALYESHYERVVRYVAFRIGNVTEAEDMASEVFIRALRSVGTYKETGAPLEAWIFKIARNLVVDYFRQKSRRPASTPLEEEPSLSHQDNPLENIEHQEEVQQLSQAMNQLSEAQRQLLALRFGGSMTSEQVGMVMGKKPGAIREMQSAAIKKLRQALRTAQ